MQASYFMKKRLSSAWFWLVLLALTAGAVILTEFDFLAGFAAVPKAVQWGITQFYPTADSLEKLPDIMDKLVETIMLSIASTTVAGVAALALAVMGSRTMQVHVVFSIICRGIASVFRNIDVSAWSLILLFSFGQHVLTGYFALFFVSFGFLTRAFVETIDEVSSHSVEALRAVGAGYFSIVCRAVIPSAMPQKLSWVLFMMETNIRSATLIGILTGTGIGFSFDLYYKSFDYHTASLVVVCIVVTILAIEWISNTVRRMIL
ncbi:ABC transporter permease subunit [Paenibacillus sp. J5C_2022]|uniref:PhnE/PtxC family ABC transporter permease n=1 Tax=Paenibacillus sp. J5C2022 TaxID=2977129 RepID=UPI0021CF3A21|nr:ABC transporter permease subunit [Paenibacillus sp. J5C2022]MCU6710181.1 ABC transporter permease subunit [Paenibacillus sp. J5C2022]